MPEPTEPTEPVEPTGQTEPVEPPGQTEPVDAAESVEPVEPGSEAPVEPVDAAEVPEPTDPTEPTQDPEPAEPTELAEAAGPDEPAEPGDPAEPGEPADARVSQTEDGRARLKRALLHPGRNQVVVAILLALVGMAAVVEVRSNNEADTYANMRQGDLINILEGLTGTVDRTRREIATLEQTSRDLQQSATAKEAAAQQARDRLTTLDILAGRVPVKGAGIHVRIEVQPTESLYIPVVDSIQELRTAGAEALEINDKVRVVAQTSISSNADGLVVDGTLVRAPFTVEAIGVPEKLNNAMTIRDGPVAQFAKLGAETDIEERDRVEITSVTTASGASGEASEN